MAGVGSVQQRKRWRESYVEVESVNVMAKHVSMEGNVAVENVIIRIQLHARAGNGCECTLTHALTMSVAIALVYTNQSAERETSRSTAFVKRGAKELKLIVNMSVPVKIQVMLYAQKYGNLYAAQKMKCTEMNASWKQQRQVKIAMENAPVIKTMFA